MGQRNGKHVILDTWALVKGDAEDTRYIEQIRANMRQQWSHMAGLQVRTFKRAVKAGGAEIPVVAIVARAPQIVGGLCPRCGERPVQNNGRGSCDTCAEA